MADFVIDERQAPMEASVSDKKQEQPPRTDLSDIELATDSDQTVIQDPNAPKHPREGIATWRWVATAVALYVGALLYGLDTTVAADVQGPIYESLGHIENLSWIGIGFPMASASIILFMGRMYSMFDVKPVMIVSIATFEVGSALCGAAPNSTAIIFGRVIAGVGGSGMYLGCLTFMSVFTTKMEGPLYNALIGISWGIGAILGPVVGGALSDSKASWRWAFYINLPMAAILSPIYFFVLPRHNPRKDLSLLAKLRLVDWIGAVLFGAVIVLFMVVVSFSGSTYAWNSGASISLWVVWGVCLITLVVQQGLCLFTTPELRIFPVHFLKKPILWVLYAVTAAASCGNGIAVYYVPLFFQVTHNDTALHAAVRLLPYITVFITFVLVAGILLPVLQRYNIFYIVGSMLSLVGGCLLFTIDENTSSAFIYGSEVLLGAGQGLMFQVAYTVAGIYVAPQDRPHSLGFINVAQIGSIAISLSIAGSLFQNIGFELLKEGYAGYNLPDDYVRSALAGTLSPIFKSADPAMVEIAIHAMTTTIQRIFGMLIASGSLVLVLSIFMPWKKIQLEATESRPGPLESSDQEPEK